MKIAVRDNFNGEMIVSFRYQIERWMQINGKFVKEFNFDGTICLSSCINFIFVTIYDVIEIY